MARIYVASSWRNEYQPWVVSSLRLEGHEVYDFRNPGPEDHGFDWAEIDPCWKLWTPDQLRLALAHPIARHHFGLDFGGMEWAEQCVLVLPCGRSAHLEAGWFLGHGRPIHIYSPLSQEPELMYLLGGDCVCSNWAQVRARIAAAEVRP
jgi:hypothetical protein